MFIPLKDENPTEKFPVITVCLIALNCLIFAYQILSPQGLEYYVLKFYKEMKKHHSYILLYFFKILNEIN